jgi:hypothetical protein
MFARAALPLPALETAQLVREDCPTLDQTAFQSIEPQHNLFILPGELSGWQQLVCLYLPYNMIWDTKTLIPPCFTQRYQTPCYDRVITRALQPWTLVLKIYP